MDRITKLDSGIPRLCFRNYHSTITNTIIAVLLIATFGATTAETHAGSCAIASQEVFTGIRNVDVILDSHNRMGNKKHHGEVLEHKSHSINTGTDGIERMGPFELPCCPFQPAIESISTVDTTVITGNKERNYSMTMMSSLRDHTPNNSSTQTQTQNHKTLHNDHQEQRRQKIHWMWFVVVVISVGIF